MSQILQSQTIQQMHIFNAVIESGSFTKAAECLGIAKSSVSKQVRLLEQHFGVRLLHRETRKLILTEEGRAILPHCSQIKQSSMIAQQTIDQLKGSVEGDLKVSLPPMIAEKLMKTFLPDFLNRYPQLTINLNVTEDVTEIINNNIDVALRVAATIDDQYVAKKIGSIHGAVYAAPSYLDEFGTPQTLTDLESHNFLILEKQSGKTVHLIPMLKNNSTELVKVSGNITSNNIQMIKSAALQGMGLAVLSPFSIENELENGLLLPVLASYKTVSLPIYAVHSQRLNLPPKIKLFLHHVRPHLDL